MAKVTLSGSKRIRLEGGSVPPSFLNERGKPYATFPLCGDIIRRFQELNGRDATEITQGVRTALVPMRERQAALQELRGLADTDWEVMGDRLFPFQRVGARWLLTAKKGILADSQGLGKTVQSLVAAEAADPRRGIIVCNSAKIQDWVDHVKEWTTRTPLVLKGSAETRREILSGWKDEFLVCNFAQAAINLGLRADLVIIDEAHNIRNRKADKFTAIEGICAGAEWVFLLTATPAVNAAEDIWSLLHMVDLPRFNAYWLFAKRFFEVTYSHWGVKVGGILEEEREALDRILAVYMLQRGKEELTGLPTRTRRVLDYRMGSEQARLHRDMLLREAATSDGETVYSEGTLSQITRLRQLAIDPGLLFEGYRGESKLDLLVETVRGGEGKAVVFTMFETAAERAADRLNQEGIHTVLLTGSMNARARLRAVEYFANEADVLVVTHKTGGEGLNLVMARRAIFLDLAWHPAGNTHAEDRIYRIGQTAEDVETIVLWAKGSIEDHVFDIVSQKREVTIEEILRRARNAEAARAGGDGQPEPVVDDGVSAGLAPWVS